MGYYIQVPENLGKAKQLQDIYQAEIIHNPPGSFTEVPLGKALICVVENPGFDAAAFCYSREEFQEFLIPDGRPRTWVLMDYDLVVELSGYKG